MPGIGIGIAPHEILQTYSLGGFSPLDIAGCILWLDASQIEGLVDGNPVATWIDLSGSGNNATQGVGGSQPSYETNEQNGLPIVRNDGLTNDYMILPGPITPRTLFIVQKVTHPVDMYFSWIVGEPGANRAGVHFTSLGVCQLGDYNINMLSLPALNVTHLFTLTVNTITTIGLAGLNADALVGGDYSASVYDPTVTEWLFARRVATYGTEDVAEFIIYDTVLSDANIALVRAYLNAKWAIY